MPGTPPRFVEPSATEASPTAAPEQTDLIPPPSPAWVDPRSNGLLSICVVAILAAPLIVYSVGSEHPTTLDENRALAPAPVFGADPLASLPAKIEAYYADRFGFRASLIRVHGVLFRRWLQASTNELVFGKDRWVFYAGENIFEDFLGMRPLSEEQLRRWKDYLEDRRQTLAEHNKCRYLFVIGPDKNTIYPEKLPDYLRKHRDRSRCQQLMEYLRSTRSPADVLDLHEALLRAKPQGVLYFPEDSHWNGRGFFVAYQAICLALRGWFPEITPQALGQSYVLRSETSIIGDWRFVGLPEQNLTYAADFLVPRGTEKARKVTAPPLPDGVHMNPEPWLQPLLWVGPGQHRLLIFHDSYMRSSTRDADETQREQNSAYQPLAEHFAQTLLIGHRGAREEQLLIEQFHPDIVIEEHAERLLAIVPAARLSRR
jgi:SGNH hydrolase-like domain, acetyltransferase AlgX